MLRAFARTIPPVENTWNIDYCAAMQHIQSNIDNEKFLGTYFSYLIHQAFAPQVDDTHISEFVEFVTANVDRFESIYSKIALLFRNLIAFSDTATYYIGRSI